MKLIFAFILTNLLSLSFEDNKELAATYINTYKDVAIQEMHRTGIPASIKLAQGLLESNWGRSDLAKTANNHFGIKCGSRWEGGTFYKEDDDKNAKGQLIESCFRSFGSPLESYMAHSDFLSDPRKEYRYGFLFEYESDDYKAWAKGLKKSGYATDPAYPKKLISIIEQYDLNRFDIPLDKKQLASATSSDAIKVEVTDNTTVLKNEDHVAVTNNTNADESPLKTETKPVTNRMPAKHVSRLAYDIDAINNCRKVNAKGGETIEELARAVGLSKEEILMVNEVYVRGDEVLAQGDFVFIEKKKRSYKGVSEFHKVQEGETMETIAQLYGIRVKSLYAKNRMPKNSKTILGQKLSLKRTIGLDKRPKFILNDSSRKHKYLFENDANN